MKWMRRVLSLLLVIALLAGLVPAATRTARAEGSAAAESQTEEPAEEPVLTEEAAAEESAGEDSREEAEEPAQTDASEEADVTEEAKEETEAAEEAENAAEAKEETEAAEEAETAAEVKEETEVSDEVETTAEAQEETKVSDEIETTAEAQEETEPAEETTETPEEPHMHEGPHVYRDGVCTLCGEHIAWDLYFTDEARTDEYIRIYSTDDAGNRVLLSHAELREIAVIVVMLKTDQPDYRYDVGMNADWHGNENTFAYNDIYVQTMGQFNEDYQTLYLTLMLNEKHELDVFDVSGGKVKMVLFSKYDEVTGTYDNLSPNGNPQYGLEIDMVRREPGEKPPVAKTVKDSGFKINLYDYDVQSEEKDINDVSSLQFYNAEKAQSTAKESNRVYDSSIARQGIVEEVAGKDGFPALTEFRGDSLDVLFDEQEIPNAKEVYRNVDGLFQYNAKGGLVYDSVHNYAYYDKSQGDGGQFTVYDGTYNRGRLTDLSKIDSGIPIGFFPFDDYNDLRNMTSAQSEDSLNHGHGMFIEGTVYIPENGKIDGEPLTFKFEGDDDVWLFIDDVLVLDGGGIHSKISGMIDFSDGSVTVSNAVSIGAAGNTTGTNTDLDTIFQNVGKTFTKEGEHVFKFYSLERDGDESDLKIETNLNKVLDQELTDVTVEKKWVDENGEDCEPWLESVTVQLCQTVDGETTEVEGKTLTLNEENEWKGIFGSLPAKNEDGTWIDYSVKEKNADGTYVTYERGGEEVRSDIYWVRADLSEGMEPGIYAIMGDEYETDETGESSPKSHVLLTAQGEDKEVAYRDTFIYPAEEPIVDPRDGKTYTEYIKPVDDDQIWTIAKTDPVKSVIRVESTTEYETVAGPDGTFYKVLAPFYQPYTLMSLFMAYPNLLKNNNLYYLANSNTELYVVDDGDSSKTIYNPYETTFYVKDEDGNFVPLEDERTLGTNLIVQTYIWEDGYIKCVDNNTGDIYYAKDGEDGYYRKSGSSYEKLSDEESSRLTNVSKLANCEKNEDGYVIWHSVANISGQPTQIYSDETLYTFYQKLDDGTYEKIDSQLSRQYMPTVIPDQDENGYTILHTTTYDGPMEYYYAKDDGTIWEKDEDGNYTQVFMSGSNGGYVKMKVTETEGPDYEWVIGNQGLNLTLVGPGQQWMDYTFITSKKDGQGNSNDSVLVNQPLILGSSYLQQFYSDYNYRNVFRFDPIGSEYGNQPGDGTYEDFGFRIFSFQDIWIFAGVSTPYEKNVTINASPYSTKESYDLSQAGRFWFYKPVPVPQTYDMSENDWTLINSPAGSLSIFKEMIGDPFSTDDVFTFTVTLKDAEGNTAENITGTFGDMEFVGGIAVVNLKAGESATAENLPAGLTYTVDETVPDPYVLDSKSGESGTIEKDETAEAVFYNRVPKGSLKVEKTVEGEDAPDAAFTFKVTLSDTSVNGTYGEMEFTDGKAEFTLKDGESRTADGLPAGITYTVVEEPVKDFTLKESEGADGTIEDGKTAEAKFVNEYEKPEKPVPETVDITVTKTWEDDDDKDQIRPESITVRLLADGEEVDNATLTEKDGWKHTFKDLPKNGEGGAEIEYTVKEDAVEGYETVIDGYKITNRHTPEETTTEETTTEEETTTKKEDPKPTPVTMDDSHVLLWTVLFLMALAAAAYVVLHGRRMEE